MKENLKQTCCITCGLPGSGKTTWAKNQVELARVMNEDPIIRINNDDIREEIGGPNFVWSQDLEKNVRIARFAKMESALVNGHDIIVDNTHLNPKTLKSLKTWIQQKFPDVVIEEKDFRDVPLSTCLERDKNRKNSVGSDVIMKMAKEANLIPEITPYPEDINLPWTIICDLDGTLALFGNSRNPYDASHCDEIDEPNKAVLGILNMFIFCSGQDFVPNISKLHFFSGRTDNYREPTLRFLNKKCGFDFSDPQYKLVMRVTGDKRSDEIVKREMFEEHIRGKYNVFMVIDDRNKVCRMWYSMGLPLFNVGSGEEF